MPSGRDGHKEAVSLCIEWTSLGVGVAAAITGQGIVPAVQEGAEAAVRAPAREAGACTATLVGLQMAGGLAGGGGQPLRREEPAGAEARDVAPASNVGRVGTGPATVQDDPCRTLQEV